jgi:hypothetical protein
MNARSCDFRGLGAQTHFMCDVWSFRFDSTAKGAGAVAPISLRRRAASRRMRRVACRRPPYSSARARNATWLSCQEFSRALCWTLSLACAGLLPARPAARAPPAACCPLLAARYPLRVARSCIALNVQFVPCQQ